MIRSFKSLLIIIFFSTITIHANSETSWITKKDSNKKKIVKETKTETSNWIKKKEVKENKKKFKEKIKESKSWITKKSKKKLKDIKNNLKKHKEINKLPTAEFYFAAMILPKDNEVPIYAYGYVNSDKTSKTFKYNGNDFFSKSDGIAFLDNGKTTCEVDSQIGEFLGDMMGKIVVRCINKLEMTGKFIQKENVGKSLEGETKSGNNVEFEFFNSKDQAIAKLNNYKNNETRIARKFPTQKSNKSIKLEPNGKYYALLIGNSNYDNNGWDDLISPINDINEIKSVLDKSYKFEKIMMVRDGTKKEIFQAFKDLSKITTTNDYVLIYYSGHGQVKATQAYWVPVEGSLEWGNGDWININELNIFLTEIKAHHLAVMVDSCYVGGKFKGSNILDLKEDEQAFITDHLRDDLNLRARIVLSSGSEGRVSDTAPNSKNSIFASTFLNNLRIAEKVSIPLTMTTLGFNVKRSFTGNSNQKPYYYHPDTWTHLGGDFIFIPKQNLQ